jgi:hypothetical protein
VVAADVLPVYGPGTGRTHDATADAHDDPPPF